MRLAPTSATTPEGPRSVVFPTSDNHLTPSLPALVMSAGKMATNPSRTASKIELRIARDHGHELAGRVEPRVLATPGEPTHTDVLELHRLAFDVVRLSTARFEGERSFRNERHRRGPSIFDPLAEHQVLREHGCVARADRKRRARSNPDGRLAEPSHDVGAVRLEVDALVDGAERRDVFPTPRRTGAHRLHRSGMRQRAEPPYRGPESRTPLDLHRTVTARRERVALDSNLAEHLVQMKDRDVAGRPLALAVGRTPGGGCGGWGNRARGRPRLTGRDRRIRPPAEPAVTGRQHSKRRIPPGQSRYFASAALLPRLVGQGDRFRTARIGCARRGTRGDGTPRAPPTLAARNRAVDPRD